MCFKLLLVPCLLMPRWTKQVIVPSQILKIEDINLHFAGQDLVWPIFAIMRIICNCNSLDTYWKYFLIIVLCDFTGLPRSVSLPLSPSLILLRTNGMYILICGFMHSVSSTGYTPASNIHMLVPLGPNSRREDWRDDAQLLSYKLWRNS